MYFSFFVLQTLPLHPSPVICISSFVLHTLSFLSIYCKDTHTEIHVCILLTCIHLNTFLASEAVCEVAVGA